MSKTIEETNRHIEACGEYTYFDEEPPVEFVDEEEEETWRN